MLSWAELGAPLLCIAHFCVQGQDGQSGPAAMALQEDDMPLKYLQVLNGNARPFFQKLRKNLPLRAAPRPIADVEGCTTQAESIQIKQFQSITRLHEEFIDKDTIMASFMSAFIE